MKKLILFFTTVFIFIPTSVFSTGSYIGKKMATPVVIDSGDGPFGFDVTINDVTATLVSDSGENTGLIWRLRTFQVNDTTFDVWMGSHTAVSFGTGAGWIIPAGGSFTTNGQGSIYAILDPASAGGNATINGPHEYKLGEYQ